MNYLLDTCVISELVAKQPNPQVLNWVDTQPEETLYLSVITLGEIAKGVNKLPPSKRQTTLSTWLNHTLPQRFTSRLLDIDRATMLQWGKLVAQLEKQGRSLPIMDSLIAAIALHHTLQLVTRNEEDFIDTGLILSNPWSL